MNSKQLVPILGAVVVAGLGIGLAFWINGGSQRVITLQSEEVSENVIPPFPEPNGYEILLKVAQQISEPKAGDVASMSRGELESYLSDTSDTFTLIEEVFAFDSRVNLDGETEFSPKTEQDLAALERLGKRLLAEARLAEDKVQIRDAMDYYLVMVRLGTYSARGGIPKHWGQGAALEQAGVEGLKGLLRRLNRENLARARKEMTTILGERPDGEGLLKWASLLDQTIHAEHRADLTGNEIERITEEREAALRTSLQQLRAMRLLLLRLCVRAYEFDQGALPETLSDLVPDYLEAIPGNPLGVEPFGLADLGNPEA